jgi:hypothetical protein
MNFYGLFYIFCYNWSVKINKLENIIQSNSHWTQTIDKKQLVIFFSISKTINLI